MSPTLKTSEGGRIGENGDERAGSAASGRTGAGSCQRVDARGSGRADGAELPANQAAVEAYRKYGSAGLVHGSAGRRSNRAKPQKLRAKVLRLIRSQYSGEPSERFGPTLAAEHLASEKGIEIGAGTLRPWMLAAGLWSRERKVRAHRNRRARREHFGELVQMDGSFHQWLEERGPRGCLMNLVDDATGTTLCRMGEQETIWAAVGIQIIAARSPQAKGRVERNHGTHQDRLVKKLRRKKITTHAEVNRYLEEEYCDEHNRRFAVEARSEVDYHLPAPGGRKLREIFRLEDGAGAGQRLGGAVPQPVLSVHVVSVKIHFHQVYFHQKILVI